MTRGCRHGPRAQFAPCISASRWAGGRSIEHCAWSAAQYVSVSSQGERTVLELDRIDSHLVATAYMSAGKVTSLSADCAASGAIVGSSTIVADSSGADGGGCPACFSGAD